MYEREHDLVAALEADLLALAGADADLERDSEVAERTRIERTTITLLDRMRAADTALDVTTSTGARAEGRVRDAGADWVLLAPDAHAPSPSPSRERIVRVGSMVSVRGLGRSASASRSPLSARPLASILRAWCRDRSTVDVHLADRSVVAGLALAAYADHLDIATSGRPVSVPYAAIAVISR